MLYHWTPEQDIIPGCQNRQPGLVFSMAEHPDHRNPGFRFYEDSFLFEVRGQFPEVKLWKMSPI